MDHDFIRLANDMRLAHALGLPFRIPAMTMRDLAALFAIVQDVPAAEQLH